MKDVPNPPTMDSTDSDAEDLATAGTPITLTVLGEDNPGIDETWSQATDGCGNTVPWFYRFTGGSDGNGTMSTTGTTNMKYMFSFVARDAANDTVAASITELTAADGASGETSGNADGSGWKWSDGKVQIKLKPKTGGGQTTWRLRFRWVGGTPTSDSGRYGIRLAVGAGNASVQCDPFWQYQ